MSQAAFPTDSPLPKAVRLVEVGLRDGLQSVPTVLPTQRKLQLIDLLAGAGIRHLQVASFVNPARVPQMADAEELCAALPALEAKHQDVTFSGLALNRRGVERLAAAGLTHLDISLSASEPHSLRNAGMGIEEATDQITASIAAARELGLTVRAGVQCVFGSDAGEEVPLERVTRLAAALVEAGATELALADSAGLADPLALAAAITQVRAQLGNLRLTLHLHDTWGLGLANLLTALRLGVDSFDTAFGALGGCPFIAGAAGNVGTEDAVHLLEGLGIGTGIDLRAVAHATALVEGWLEASMPSRVYRLTKDHAPRAQSKGEQEKRLAANRL